MDRLTWQFINVFEMLSKQRSALRSDCGSKADRLSDTRLSFAARAEWIGEMHDLAIDYFLKQAATHSHLALHVGDRCARQPDMFDSMCANCHQWRGGELAQLVRAQPFRTNECTTINPGSGNSP